MAKFICNFTEKALSMVAAAMSYSKPLLATFWHYIKVELVSQPLVKSLQLFRA